jgi:sulfite reductase beta subunit-like hemoprotein
MAAIDESRIVGRGSVNFASEKDIDEFVNLLGKFERGEMGPDDWRRYRLTRGTYGQRQDGVQMLRVKAPQGVVSSGQMRAFATVASKYSRGFGHVTTRQNIQLHFVLLKDCEDAMRILGEEGLTTREACGNAVRNVTGCPYMGTSSSEIFDVYPYAEALTRYFLRHPLAAVLPRKFKIAFEGCTEDHALASINDIGWRAKIQDGRRGFRVTVAGGTSIMPVSGYLLYDFLPVEEMQNVAEAVLRVFHKYGDYEHRQRNRMKFVVKQLGWETFRARVMEELDAFVAAGGAPLRHSVEQL